MCCRGFDGRFRCLARARTRPVDVAMFLVVLVVAAALVLADLLLR
jgi:hypothetical protein